MISRIEDLESTGVGAIASPGAVTHALALEVGMHVVVAGFVIAVASRVGAPVASGVGIDSALAGVGIAVATRVGIADASRFGMVDHRGPSW